MQKGGRFGVLSSELKRLPELALRHRRQGLAQQLPPVAETLRGSLVERYVTCGNPACKCARGERHGPVWYLTVTLGQGRTTGGIVPSEKVDQVRSWIENYHKVKDHLGIVPAREPDSGTFTTCRTAATALGPFNSLA